MIQHHTSIHFGSRVADHMTEGAEQALVQWDFEVMTATTGLQVELGLCCGCMLALY